MWFLLIEIALLLIFAAILGGLFAYWWMKSRYEDVTASYEAVHDRMSVLDHMGSMLSRNDFEAGVKYLEDKIDANAAALNIDDKLGFLATELKKQTSSDRIDVAEEMLRRVDDRLARLTTRLAGVSHTDLRPLESEIRALRRRLDAPPARDGKADNPQIDLTPLEMLLADIDRKLSERDAHHEQWRQADRQSFLGGLDQISATVASSEKVDLSPLTRRLHEVERALIALDRPEVDLSPLEERLAQLDHRLSDMGAEIRRPIDVTPVERRLDEIRSAVSDMPATDLEPLLASLGALGRRMDFGALENRITAIEYGLAALHHTLRNRMGESMDSDDDGYSAMLQKPSFSKSSSDKPARMKVIDDFDTSDADERNATNGATQRRYGRANLLQAPSFGRPDNLTAIDGVGPMLNELLNQIGVYYFWQIAEWTPEEADWVDEQLLRFKGRISRDRWIAQAKRLARNASAARRPT